MIAKLNVLRSDGKVGAKPREGKTVNAKTEWSLSNSIWWIIVSQAAGRSNFKCPKFKTIRVVYRAVDGCCLCLLHWHVLLFY